MILYALVEGGGMTPAPFDVRRYRCRDEGHAGDVLALLAPNTGRSFSVWRLAPPDLSEWLVAFCVDLDPHDPTRAQLVDELDGLVVGAGATADATLDSYDAQALVRRRIVAAVSAISSGRVSRERGFTTEAHFGTSGAILDPETGELTVRRSDA